MQTPGGADGFYCLCKTNLGDFKTKSSDFLLCRHPVVQTVLIVCVRQIFGDFKTNLADFFAVQTPGGADGFYCLCTTNFWGF